MPSSVLKPHGYIAITTIEGHLREADTLQCVHCGMHWMVVKGSGRRRGFCTRCAGPTCGQHACDECVPMEQQLENIEAGRDQFHRPTRLWIPKSIGE